MEDSVVIFTDKLVKSYGKVEALHGVNLEVHSGEIFGFLGPNGAGKTTTIRCLLDLIRPNGGTVKVLGLDPQKSSLEVRKRTGYLPSELYVEDNATVASTLRYLNGLRRNVAEWSDVEQLLISEKNLLKANDIRLRWES